MMTVDQNFPLPDLTGLTEDEKRKLLSVMKKVKEFEQQEGMELLRQPLEGQLSKYTNVVKGWQYRWFILEPQRGRLDYFEKAEYKRQKARGFLHLAGAQISPSDEDEQTFSISAANGEVYRLRASDAKERQHWVTRLRATAEYHTDRLLQSEGSIHRDSAVSLQSSLDSLNRSHESLRKAGKSKSYNYQQFSNKYPAATQRSPVIITLRSQHKTTFSAAAGNLSQCQFKEVREMLAQVGNQQTILSYRIEELPASSTVPCCTDTDLLMLKATSGSTLACLDQCLSILQQHSSHASSRSSAVHDWFTPTSSHSKPRSGSISPTESFVSATSMATLDAHARIDHEEEVEDASTYVDTDLTGVEDQKSVILHLLSQLKLGMDLTKVVLPTFILEKRSLLEMFADCMAHPAMFLRIPDLQDPESRMLAVLEWYLTSFHAGRQGTVAKKPYNPIIGEHFHCSWTLSSQTKSAVNSQSASKHCDHVNSNNTHNAPVGYTDQSTRNSDKNVNSDDLDGSRAFNNQGQTSDHGQSKIGLYYCAEQVSHHPPISAFYCESPEKQMYIESSIWTKSKFLGMSIGVILVGKAYLHLLSHDDETYELSLPSAYARSILTVPWVELGDKLSIQCPKTGYSASVIFHTKPFYGGTLHRVTSEVKRPNGDVICKTQGEWNHSFNFTYSSGDTKLVEVADLEIRRKSVRPISAQSEFESRRLWSNVTQSLADNDVDSATEHKRFLEERQRQGERHRRESNTEYPTRYFHKDGDQWLFNNSLKPGQTEPSL